MERRVGAWVFRKELKAVESAALAAVRLSALVETTSDMC